MSGQTVCFTLIYFSFIPYPWNYFSISCIPITFSSNIPYPVFPRISRIPKTPNGASILRPPAKRIQIKLYEPHLGKEKPVMGNIEPLLGITKPAEGLNKPCQGNVNGRKSFAAEGFNVKIPFISQTYTKAVAISSRQSHIRTRNLVKYHPSSGKLKPFFQGQQVEICKTADTHAYKRQKQFE